MSKPQKPTAKPAAPVAEKAPVEPTVKAEATSRTVIVASKIPQTIIIQLYDPRKVQVQGRYGPADETQMFPVGVQHFIRGTARPAGQAPAGFPSAPDMEEGYALTPGIPADFWEKWLAQNSETDMVRNRMIFAVSDRASAKSAAREMVGARSGLEPLDMSGDRPDPRVPRPVTNQIEGVKTAEGLR